MIISVVPWNEIEVGTSPFAHAWHQMGYPAADLIMNGIVLVAVLSCLNSGIYITSRAMFGLAKNGDAPQACVTLSRSKVPARAILIASLFSYGALAAAVISPDRVLNFLVTSSGAIMLFIYILIAVAQLRLRKKLQAEDPSKLQIKMWFYPYGTWAAIAGMVGVLILMGLSASHAMELWASVIVAAVFWVSYVVKSRLRPK
jgi:L-asparagine transporter-like permease